MPDSNPHNLADRQEKSDEELVVLTLSNPDWFAGLIERYREPLTRYLRRRSTARPEEIEDMLQEIFIKAYLNLNDFDRQLKFSSWIYRIAHNQSVDLWRKAKAHPAQPIDPEDNFWLALADEFDLEREASRRELAEQVRQLVDQLPADYREVLTLRFLEDKDYQEIADILEKPPGTIATLLSRGKIRLRKLWAEANQKNHD